MLPTALPSPRGAHWFSGHAVPFQRTALSFLAQLDRECGPLGRFQIYNRWAYFVNDPVLIHELLVEHARVAQKSLGLRLLLYPLAGEGLFTSNGELWRRQRKLMAPLFQPSQMARYAAGMVECANALADHWRDGSTHELSKEMTTLTMRVVGKALFTLDTLDESDEIGAALARVLHWANTRVASVGLVLRLLSLLALEKASPARAGALARGLERVLYDPPLVPTEENRAFLRAKQTLETHMQQMIEARRADPGAHRDLLSILLQARDDEGKGMSDKQLRDEVVTLFVAGHETTAAALTWAFFLLSQHPEQEARLFAEADALGRRPPTYDDLPRLPYALQIFKEAMRLYPPVPLISRQTTEPITLGGVEFPARVLFFVSPYTLHRNPAIWPDPERFAPERFTPEAEAARHRHAYLPFGGGPRVCIGNHFALMEGTLLLTTLAQRFSFRLRPGFQPIPTPTPALRPENGLWGTVRARR